MTGIQWVLLVLVVAAVVGAYLYMRRQTGDDPWRDMEEAEDPEDFGASESLGGDSYIVGVRTLSSGSETSRDEPGSSPFGMTPEPSAATDDEPSWQAFAADDASPGASDNAQAVRPRRPPAGEQRLFILHVACRDERLFDGPAIHAALQAQKLKFGLNSIYHRITEINGVPESVFAVANMVKPGFLDPVEQDHLQTPGLTLFLQLPGPIEGGPAVRDLLETASSLAEQLGSEVLDDRRSLLKPQMAQYMLDEVAEIDRQQRLAGHR